MAETQTIDKRSSEKLRGSERRSCNVSTKLTPNRGEGRRRSRLASGQDTERMGRELLLHGVVATEAHADGRAIFAELAGIQMLSMNMLEPLLRGDKLAQQLLTVLFRQVHDDQGREVAGTPS